MSRKLDLGIAKVTLSEMEGDYSNNCIRHVKECGYFMAEKMGLLRQEKELLSERVRTLFEELKTEGYTQADILAVSPLFGEVLP